MDNLVQLLSRINDLPECGEGMTIGEIAERVDSDPNSVVAAFGLESIIERVQGANSLSLSRLHPAGGEPMSGNYDYEILICPVCREQVGDDPEYGAYCYHAEYGSVAAVEVPVAVLGADMDKAISTVATELAVQRRKLEEREAEAARFRALPKAERDRIKAERRAKMSPLELVFEDAILEQVRQTRAILSSGSFTTVPTVGSATP